LTEALEKGLKKKRADGKKTYDVLADTLINLAIEKGDVTAIRYIFDSVDGRPRETVELTVGSVELKLREIMNE
jgi:hypothetical protein